MKCKFHWPTLIIHLVMCNTIFFYFFEFFFYFLFLKIKNNILIKPRMKCMNEMQKNKILSKNILVHRNERYNTRTMSDKLSEVKSFASTLS